jgi:hypothetical protein
MVSPSEWGAGAWQLLHGIAERIGNHSNHLLIQDERNELRLTLRHFWALLPCLKCQKHYKEWIIKNNPDSWIQGPFGSDLQDSMRNWVFNLHENVNKSRSVESGFTLEQMKPLYSAVSLKEKANGLKSFYQKGLDARTLKSEDWKVAWKHLDLLLRAIG